MNSLRESQHVSYLDIARIQSFVIWKQSQGLLFYAMMFSQQSASCKQMNAQGKINNV
jgi:hypothetical protein